MYLKIRIFFLFLLIISCQPIETIKPVEIENKNFPKISINVKNVLINIKYDSVFSDENIEDQVESPPLKIITDWNKENINIFGNENTLIINIIDASIYRSEIENTDAKKYEEKTIYKYKIFYLVEYQLFDDSDILLANTTVESSRSTTSRKYISLNERELIINDLTYNSLKDFSTEAKSLFETYMLEYLE